MLGFYDHTDQQGNRVKSEMMKVVNKWDRNSPDCEFKYYFYNNVGIDLASRHVKHPNEDEKAYDKAWAERPSPGYTPPPKKMKFLPNSLSR